MSRILNLDCPAVRALAKSGSRMAVLALATATLSACAMSGARLPTHQEEMTRLTAQCEARGGVLTPSGSLTGREAIDNHCRVVSGPSERIRPRT